MRHGRLLLAGDAAQRGAADRNGSTSMSMRRSLPHALLATVTAALVLAGCSGDDATMDPTTTSPPESSAGTDGTEPADAIEPIRIGVLTSFTGPFTTYGVQAAAGMRMAADEINADGGVDGRMVELVEADDENNPESGVAELERLVEQDDIVAAGGMISSDVALATSLAAEELQTPLLLVKAGAASILSPDSRYTFRTCLPAAPMVAGPIVDYIESEGITRVGAIIADYAWGQSVKGALETGIGDLDGVELQVETAPVGETEFTTYLRNLQGFDPQIIVATGHPPGAGPITIQATDLGLDVKVTGPYATLAGIHDAVGDVALGRYTDFGCADFQSDDYVELATRFVESSEFTFMEADAVAGYGIVTMVAEAVTEVGDDPAAVAEYLHANAFDLPGYAFPVSWTEWGELAEATPHFVQMVEATPPDDINPGANWYVETLTVPDPLEPHVPE